MKRFFLFGLIVLVAASCNEDGKKYGDPLVSPESILKNNRNYAIYNQRYVTLWKEFTALDESSNKITKEAFLKALTTGSYLPLRLTSTDSNLYYRLHKLPTPANADISYSVKRYAGMALEQFSMEGKLLPDFRFTDLNGEIYDRENTKGKFVVLKCWFINCVPCVKEMPQLNKMKESYNNRKDVLFISLATDEANELKAFLEQTSFNYAVVPEQGEYMADRLGITAYPTHLIVDGKGVIRKVVNKQEELAEALQEILFQKG